MRFYEASASINAPASSVWDVLTDGRHYPDWDSGIERVDGEIGAGARFTLVSEAAGGRAFPLSVTAFEAPRRMVWAGGMPLGLFRGERVFELTQVGETTGFRMREEFTGPLVPLFWRKMPDLGPAFTRFARGLKARVESESTHAR